MRVVEHSQPNADPVYRKLHRAFFAACMVLAPLALVLWFSLCPPYSDPTCPTQGALPAFRAMNPHLREMFVLVNIVVPYVYPLSYIGLGLLAMKRSPWLATLGIAFGWVGSIPWSWFAGGQIGLLDTMAQMDPNPVFVPLIRHLATNQIVLAFAVGWVPGHLLGYVLLGIALARARAVPQWSAWLIAVSALVMGPIAYGTQLGLLQILGYGLVLIGSVPAALAMVKMGNEPAASAPRERPVPAA